jgi:ubiquinone/menaquinone biosynthesis C-methylase UbiE
MEHAPAHHHSHASSRGDSDALAELLDLDAVVLRTYWADVTAWVRRLSAGAPRRRILDLGAGTGTGTIALAQRFGGAEVVALDVSAEMLARVRVKALHLGLAERVRTVQADLDVAWPALEPVDLVWASMSLHEMADPDRLLNEVFESIRPGGLLAVAEMDAPVRFLPDDLGLGRRGLEERCLAALAEGRDHTMPFGSDWGPRLEAAGFALLDQRTFGIDLQPPHPAATGRYAQGWLGGMRSFLEDRVSAEDLATLDILIDSPGPDGLLARDDLVVRGTRTAWVAGRPPAK